MSSIFPADKADTNAAAQARYKAAVLFIEQHIAQHLDTDQLVRRCAAQLVAADHVDIAAANHMAIHALAEVQSRKVPAWIDTNHSTSYVVRVIDPLTGKVAVFTASELLALAQAKETAPTDPVHVVHSCGRSAVPS